MDKHWEYLMWNWSWRVSSACNMQTFPTASQKNRTESPHPCADLPAQPSTALPRSHKPDPTPDEQTRMEESLRGVMGVHAPLEGHGLESRIDPASQNREQNEWKEVNPTVSLSGL